MVELHPASFGALVRSIFTELKDHNSIFSLPESKWYKARSGVDCSVEFNGKKASTPLGPAAGPHTQMAQNIVLSWLGGGRIIELKTIQINDKLDIARPCIDAANVGYNIEWSQELRLESSLREYVSAMMLIEMLKSEDVLDDGGASGDTIYDMSVGYDLAGVQSKEVKSWISSMMNAGTIISDLRNEIPAEYSHLKELNFPEEISGSITLSTFHGCPAHEIESISEFFLKELNVDVVIKLNPTLLGKKKVDELLHDVMGYDDIKTQQKFFDVDLQFEQAVEMVGRLGGVADSEGRRFGVKFSNTLVVTNHKSYFPDDEIMYMSGPPLHVITMNLVNEFRKVVGGELPVSFSAGIDSLNFADAVSIGLVPVTVCTDLLRPGGYGRMHKYLNRLGDEMEKSGAGNIREFVEKRAGGSIDYANAVLSNTEKVTEAVRSDQRYRSEANNLVPKKIGSKLHLFDCVNCDKCIPVCPNVSNFYIELKPFEVNFDIMEFDGEKVQITDGGTFTVEKEHQLANYADFCNECGNCDVFCPEDGGPFIEKPRFFSSMETFKLYSDEDGFFVYRNGNIDVILARGSGEEFELTQSENGLDKFSDGKIDTTISSENGEIKSAEARSGCPGGHQLSLKTYFVMKTLLNSVTNSGSTNFVRTVLEESVA